MLYLVYHIKYLLWVADILYAVTTVRVSPKCSTIHLQIAVEMKWLAADYVGALVDPACSFAGGRISENTQNLGHFTLESGRMSPPNFLLWDIFFYCPNHPPGNNGANVYNFFLNEIFISSCAHVQNS